MKAKKIKEEIEFIGGEREATQLDIDIFNAHFSKKQASKSKKALLKPKSR